jgi:hypothetical protein
MIDAYKAGIPSNDKPFPDGAKMPKIHWKPVTNAAAPNPPTIPGPLHAAWGLIQLRLATWLGTLLTERLSARASSLRLSAA